MKILILVEEFTPEKGYMEFYLATELIKLGNDVRVLASNGSGIAKDSVLAEGFRVTLIPQLLHYYGYNLPTPAGLIKTAHILKRFRPSLVICSPAFSPLSLFVLHHPAVSRSIKVGSLVTGGPTFFTSGFYSKDSTMSLFRYLVAKLVIEKLTTRRLDRFLVLAPRLKQFLFRYLNVGDKFLVMPLGADSSLFRHNQNSRETLRQSWGVSNEAVVVVYTGQIHQTKDIPLLVEAFSQASAGDSMSKLVIIGGGDSSLLNRIRNMCVKLAIDDKVLIMPTVHRTELPGIYSACDIAVWPGGYSISIAEAASVGLPIVIMESPLTSYLVACDNGFTFPRGDVNSLTKNLELLLHDPNLRHDMGAKSRELIAQKLNWRSITKQLLSDIGAINQSKRA